MSGQIENFKNRRTKSRLDRRDILKTKKTSRTVETLFRNALRSNLELTSLADTKASILISVNGFILTVIITASGFQLSDSGMIYPFNAIILTALISITFAVLAIRPRFKRHLLDKKHQDNYESVLYFQDMADLEPDEYVRNVHKVIGNKGLTQSHIMKHLHMLGSEIQIKYIWLRRAYTSFALGLLISVGLVIFFMHQNKQEIANIENIYKSEQLLTKVEGSHK
jgi:hypothetical protein